MRFEWWWDRAMEIADCPEPYEVFEIQLYGAEAGDWQGEEETERILREKGFHPGDLKADVERLSNDLIDATRENERLIEVGKMLDAQHAAQMVYKAEELDKLRRIESAAVVLRESCRMPEECGVDGWFWCSDSESAATLLFVALRDGDV